MRIEHVHKSLASVNEKVSFMSTFLQSQHKRKNSFNSFPCQLFLLSLYQFWLTQMCIFNFDFLSYLETHNNIMNCLSEILGKLNSKL